MPGVVVESHGGRSGKQIGKMFAIVLSNVDGNADWKWTPSWKNPSWLCAVSGGERRASAPQRPPDSFYPRGGRTI